LKGGKGKAFIPIKRYANQVPYNPKMPVFPFFFAISHMATKNMAVVKVST
jgi:hypothetical protein